MGWWFATAADAADRTWIKRFDPLYWTVNFPRPMMAAVTTTAADALRVDAVFYQTDDLAGLIWESADRHDHPLLGYGEDRDYRGCVLSFRWQSTGLIPLDQINGPVLTIEGRDAAGNPRSWYVRLWNYATGTPTDATITLDFDALDGGYSFPADRDPVFAGDIDRMFVSLVPPGYAAGGGLFAAPKEAHALVSAIRCDGARSMLAAGDVVVPEHDMRIATGYDDHYHVTPARMLRNIVRLGYRRVINHYVGMSHYFRLEPAGAALVTSMAGGVLNAPCARWHADFAARAKAADFRLIWSLSYELFDAHCRAEWKQRDLAGNPALTGWVPPSTLLSPTHAGAMGYLQAVARAFAQIGADAGLAVEFQIGEPWWWVTPDGRIFLYDDAAKAAFGGSPVAIANVRGTLTAAQKALLDQAGALLAASTAALGAAVKGDHPAAAILCLVYLPTVLDPAAPELMRANVPVGWASPAFDVLQLEDYDWASAGNAGATTRGIDAMGQRLGYPSDHQHYFAGFVLRPEDRAQWAAIDQAAEAGRARGTAETFFWALPQVLRDGFVHFQEGEDGMNAFDDVSFPIALGKQASAAPEFSTAIVATASGVEQRNADWSDARLRFDAGPGVRSDADVAMVIDFFRARHGPARGFRFRDPFDHSSHGMTGAPTPTDQQIGIGDGTLAQFDLVKHYGQSPDAQRRRITRPVAGSVRIAIDGTEQMTGWTLGPLGQISFTTAPAIGSVITAGFLFDVPVRFAEDRLTVNRATHEAAEIASVPLIEIREVA